MGPNRFPWEGAVYHGENFFSVELAIAFDGFGRKVAPGEQWKIQVARSGTWGKQGMRSACLAGQQRIWRAARETFGAVGTEFAPLPAVLACDYVCYASGRKGLNSWPASRFMDETIPVWELALHGLVIKECSGITWQNVMRQDAFGEHPRIDFSKRDFRGNHVMSDNLLRKVKAVYDISLQRFGHLQFEEITNWQRPVDHVQHTSYADGTQVIIDESAQTLEVNGQHIPRPDVLND